MYSTNMLECEPDSLELVAKHSKVTQSRRLSLLFSYTHIVRELLLL